MNKIQLTYNLVCEFLQALRIEVGTETDELNILCLEGAQRLAELPGLIELVENVPDRYNDCVVLFWKQVESSVGDNGILGGGRLEESGVLRALRVLRATTEPGRYYTQLEPHPAGAAHLVWGRHIYKPGKHRGRPALVSASGLDRVWRDRDADFTQDMSERVYVGRFGIHVHAGGSGSSIGRWSAGCIAIAGGYEGEPYSFFTERVHAHPGKVISLTLWGARDLARWVAGKEDWRPTLRFGIRNPWVARMQGLLNKRLDGRLVADGDWLRKTQSAFIGFQRDAGLEIDGICGPLSWRKLENNESEVIT
ncbi:peptidoglycan-binding protein [candidate division WOR-3 bacterium]|nr:peptidoglycan-binding protein [candidate division WOR-3 bacterium]